MEISLARRVREPRMRPLASCLAIAIALGSGSLAAAPAGTLADRPGLNRMLTRFGPMLDHDYVLPQRDREAAFARHVMRPLPNAHPDLPLGSVPVTNCNDSGPGSLRDAIDNVAVTGQTIDLTNTGCSTITLTTGDIFITQDDLTLQGPGSNLLAISGNYAYSLRHSGTGTFAIYDLGVYDGVKYLDASYNLDAKGGCIYSSGTVTLSGDFVKYCHAQTGNTAYTAQGGAIYAKTGVIMVNSTVVLADSGGNGTGLGGGILTPGSIIMAYSEVGFSSADLYGGGLLAEGGLLMKYSSLIYNQSYIAGGVYASGAVTLENSTIANNDASGVVGGGFFASGTYATNIVNSTISGNTAQVVAGAAVMSYPGSISNSTVANNVETNALNTKYGGGLYLAGTIDMESTIVATNSLNHSTYGLLPDDMGGPGTLTGANDLAIFVVAPLVAPAGTLYADPLLQSLSYNGGLTSTHALTIGSPAIDAGNNTAGLSYDQRGTGYPRTIGPTTDIGAFEFNSDDVIFANGFDT